MLVEIYNQCNLSNNDSCYICYKFSISYILHNLFLNNEYRL